MKPAEYKKIRDKVGTIVKTLKLQYSGFSESEYGISLYQKNYVSPSREEANLIADQILEKLDSRSNS